MCRLLLLVLGYLGLSEADPSDMAPPNIPLWPWPSSVQSGTTVATVSSTAFAWKLLHAPPGFNTTILLKAIDRYDRYAFGAVETVSGGRTACPRSGTTARAAYGLVGLNIALSPTATDASLRMHGDESYQLDVPSAGTAVLRANSTTGVLRGLESFHQLLQFARRKQPRGSAQSAVALCEYAVMATPLRIVDRPRFTHRGLLIDTGRNYHSVGSLKRALESMAWNKMSVFHWHIIEIDAFPLELDSFPELAARAAFAGNQVYTQADVAEVVAFGQNVGVRVMPEMEMPGHMSAYGVGLPELNLTINTGAHHNVAAYGIANFASPNFLPTMAKIVREVAGMFDEELFFLGGDETDCPYNECDYADYPNQTERCPHMATARTNWTCPVSGWMQDPGVRAWAEAHSTAARNLSDHAALFRYFADHIEPVLAAAGKTPVWWNDRYDVETTRPNRAVHPASKPVVENWLRSGPTGLTPYLQQGWPVIQGSGWYLGSVLAGHTRPKARVPGLNFQSGEYCVQGPDDWAKFYLQDPYYNATGATEQQRDQLLLGGEASAWGDCISAESFDGMVWPAASAVAERLWSAQTKNNVSEAFPRLAAMRCSMVRRGVRVSPFHPGSCWSAREID